jgi:ATP-dependent DNA helicase RecQ
MTTPHSLRDRARLLLKQAIGASADFREGQWEAIEALANRRARLLVVQRTGWGKSVVYFVATRLLRDQGAGPTLLVSPLLALMRNQIEAAGRIGIRAASINSTMKVNEREEVNRLLRAGAVDVLLVSPEQFGSARFLEESLLPLAERAGLLVVDEAHCISDWGHDFRPDYRRIVRVLQRLPENIPVCATTATANDRVVADVAAQLGPRLEISRGPLVRESLRLQTVPLADDAAKLAWLAHYLPKLEGSGIVYALTIDWTERIAAWLQGRGIDAVPYSADLPHEQRLECERRLLANEVKALVATTALGMGYDKPDLGFVVHFHQPSSVVHYYQQVGRAGRSIESAYGIMLSGGDDRAINTYFIERAFPPEEEITAILTALEESDAGLNIAQLEASVNLGRMRIEQALKILSIEQPAPIARQESRWVATPHRFDAGRLRELIAHTTALRQREQEQMDEYSRHTGCLMEFLARALDDPAAGVCGRCAPCKGRPGAMRLVPEELAREAVAFLRRMNLPIEPRRQWTREALPTHGWSGNIAEGLRAEEGRALCILGDSGWGSLVRRGLEAGRVGDELVAALAALVRKWRPEVGWVTCVPTPARPLVADLAFRLATVLGIPFEPAVVKVRATRSQGEMENSWQQAHNLDGAFRVEPWDGLSGSVLLVDDVVDSRWTLTIVAALLREAGSGPVFPLALATRR